LSELLKTSTDVNKGYTNPGSIIIFPFTYSSTYSQ